MEGERRLPLLSGSLLFSEPASMYLSQAATRRRRTMHKERAGLEHCPAVSDKHFTQSSHVHRPGQHHRHSSFTLFTSDSHWAMAALLFISAISLPFTLTTSQVCTLSMWSSALWRSVHFLGRRQGTQRAVMHTLIFPSDDEYVAVLRKEWTVLWL